MPVAASTCVLWNILIGHSEVKNKAGIIYNVHHGTLYDIIPVKDVKRHYTINHVDCFPQFLAKHCSQFDGN